MQWHWISFRQDHKAFVLPCYHDITVYVQYSSMSLVRQACQYLISRYFFKSQFQYSAMTNTKLLENLHMQPWVLTIVTNMTLRHVCVSTEWRLFHTGCLSSCLSVRLILLSHWELVLQSDEHPAKSYWMRISAYTQAL